MIETKNNPYYDDFDLTKGFLKVLFKPGLSVQTRELNQLQSILQNQIAQLADSIFKDGSVVKDGKLTFKNDVNYVKLYDSYNNSNFSYENFKGRMVSGNFTLDNNEVVTVVAKVFDGFDRNNSNPGTLYLDYLGSGASSTNDENIPSFTAGQVLKIVNEIYVDQVSGEFQISETIQGDGSQAKAKLIQIDNNKYSVIYESNLRFYEGETIRGDISGAAAIFTSGETEQYMCQIQNTADVDNPVGKGTFIILSSGIYYIDGYFVSVDTQRLILSEYDTIVSAKVGFNKEIEYIDAAKDNSLYDNANGTPNENAPGADRLKLTLKLGYYGLYDEIPEQFVEIARINQSNVLFNTSNNSQWSNIMDVLAKRTFDESGSYTVNPFIVDIQEFYDNGSNNGVYKEDYFKFESQIEAMNASMEVFGEEAPGSWHRYDYKYYPLSNHETFIQAMKDRVCVGINPGLAYVLGYEVSLNNRIYVPMLKARELGMDNNSLVNIKYGNYILVNTLRWLPDLNNPVTINLLDSESNIIGTARMRMVKHHSGNLGTDEEQFRVYLTDISMNANKNFSTDVNKINITGANSFSANCVLQNNTLNIYDMNNNILLFNLPQEAVRSLEDISYDFVQYFNDGSKVASDGSITINAPSGSLFTSTNPEDYILIMKTGADAGKVINLGYSADAIDLTTGSIQGQILKIKINSSYADCTYTLLAPIHRNGVRLRNKILVNNTTVNISNPTDNMTLTYLDGYRLVGVWDSGDPDVDATEASGTNVTSNYIMDGGQRDNYYGPIVIKRLSNTLEPTGRLLIKFDYFMHGTGDYYTAESYDNTLEYEDIPSYTSENGTTYNLSNCIDLRPDYDGTDSYDSTNPKILVPGSNFQSDVNYYLPRIDLLEVDYLGNFKVKKGTSATNPQTPVGDMNTLSLYYFELPPYTSNINDIIKVYKENKRYTMRDIGRIDNRITAIENYILLTQNEYDVSNMPIVDTEGNEGYKVGYIADNFTDHSYGDIISPYYKCSIDVANNLLRPSFKLNSFNLEIDSSETTTAQEYNGMYMIPKTDVDAISQTVGTSLQRMNESGLVSWVGNLLISPSVNNQYNNIDQVKQNFNTISGINQYNGVLKKVSNTYEYNNVFSKWLGVN